MLPLQENIQCHSWSLGKVLNHLKLEYGNPPVMIHENGRSEFCVGNVFNPLGGYSFVSYMSPKKL